MRKQSPGFIPGASLFGIFLLTLVATPAAAAPSELFISEYVEGSSNNKAIEIYNGTGAAVDLAAGGYDIKMYFNGSASAGKTISLTGTVADGDVYVVANSLAAAAVLAAADQLDSGGWFNGDDAVVLGKSGADIDAFGQVGFDPGSQWTGGGQNDTLRRKAEVCAGDTNASDAFDASVEWDVFSQDSFGGLGSHTVSCEAAGPKINEFSASTTGTDVEYIEIFGAPNTDYSALTVLEIEGDFSQGTVDEAIGLGTTDANGFYLASLAPSTLENGTITLLLVSNFTGAVGNDIDTDDDGVIDFSPWDAIVDAVAVNDGGAGDLTYGVPSLGKNYDGVSSFAPGGASRIPDGQDTDSTSDWVRNDFDLAGIPSNTGSIGPGEAYNTPGAANEVYVPPPEACGDEPITLIHEIQGSGPVSGLDGSMVSIEGIVVGDFQDGTAGVNGDLNGFFVQEEDADADGDPQTSEGIFVFDGSSPEVDVQNGDRVRVSGTVDEFFGMTQISSTSFIDVCDAAVGLPTAAEIILPVASNDDFEKFEGMYVTLPQSLAIVEYFNFDRFGEIVLATDRLFQPTAVFDPGSPEADTLASMNALSQITLDDGRTQQNPDPAIHPNGGEFDLDNLFRGGDLVSNATGVMNYSFGIYRVHPTQGAEFTAVNLRTDEPEDVGGDVKVASFNVLNYFSTLDGDGSICGPLENQGCRGADNAEEFTRQRDKIFAAINATGADVVGLVEIENHPADEAVQDLVEGLNTAAGADTWDYVDSGVIGEDVIKVAMIYKPASVSILGSHAVLDSSVDPRFIDTLNRPALAQSFVSNSTGGVFTVAVNHLKSKGADCNDVGDPDTGDGAGNCNLTRAMAAEALVDWLAGDPTDSGDVDAIVIGDLNSYDKEDPIDVFTAAGYTDLAAIFQGEFSYGYLFGAQLGYLDYALASQSLFAQSSGATQWHINADEPDLLNYDTSFKKPAQDAIYAPDAYRSSDHDTVISGFSLLHYDFSGFFRPIKNVPAVNKVKAGSSIPVKFSLDGDYGLDIFADGYPLSQAIDCESGEPGDSEPTETAGGSALSYDADSDEYNYVWKSSKTWAGTCRQLIVQLDDGSVHYASFKFK